jgi:hypothetical protein
VSTPAATRPRSSALRRGRAKPGPRSPSLQGLQAISTPPAMPCSKRVAACSTAGAFPCSAAKAPSCSERKASSQRERKRSTSPAPFAGASTTLMSFTRENPAFAAWCIPRTACPKSPVWRPAAVQRASRRALLRVWHSSLAPSAHSSMVGPAGGAGGGGGGEGCDGIPAGRSVRERSSALLPSTGPVALSGELAVP